MKIKNKRASQVHIAIMSEKTAMMQLNTLSGLNIKITIKMKFQDQVLIHLKKRQQL